MIEWSKDEKEIITSSETSKEAIARYFSKYPNSNRKKSSIYTYWWWRRQEEKKKSGDVNKKFGISTKDYPKAKKDLEEEFGKDTDKIVASPVIHARIVSNNVIEVGDMVKYARTPDAPVGIVISVEQKRGIPKISQKIKVRFGNYYVRDVYICDYKIVEKGVVKL